MSTLQSIKAFTPDVSETSSLNISPSISEISAKLTEGTCAEIIQHIDFIHLLLLRASYPVRPHTFKGILKLVALPEEEREEILTRLKNWKYILTGGNTKLDLDNVNEKFLVARALSYFRLQFKGMNWDQIGDDEIIEIYNHEGVQLYRSLNFFNICGYSLLDLCVNRWFELWERPTATVKKMNEVVMEVLSGRKTTFDVDIGAHLVRETYDDGTTEPFVPFASLATFKKIFPLFSPDYEGGVMGFIVTSTGKPISSGSDVMDLDFI